jgi:hypothetical protein
MTTTAQAAAVAIATQICSLKNVSTLQGAIDAIDTAAALIAPAIADLDAALAEVLRRRDMIRTI